MQTTMNDQLVPWMLGLFAFIAVVYVVVGTLKTIKDLRARPRRSLSLKYVTKAELKEQLEKLASAGDVATIAEKVKELARYTHESVHAIKDDLNAINLRVETTQRVVGEKVASAMERVSGQVTALATDLAGVRTVLDSREVAVIKREPQS